MSQERGNANLKLLDRYLGIPIVVVLGLFRWPFRSCFKSKREGLRIGFLATAAIGDTIIASGLPFDVKMRWPVAKIILFTSQSNSTVGRLLPGFDKSLALPITKPWMAIQLLRQERLDVLIDITPWPRINSILAAFSGAECLIGFKTHHQYKHYVFDYSVEHRADRHQIENLRALLLPLGLRGKHMPSLQLEKRTEQLSFIPAPYVVFHAWPGGYKSHYKQWPKPNWMALGCLVAQLGFNVVLTGGPADRELSADLASSLRLSGVSTVDLSGQCSLEETALVIAGAWVVVSVDTGVLHMAAALNAHVIGLHGPSSSQRWGGLGVNVISIDSEVPGSGVLDLGFEYPEAPPDYMIGVSVDAVWLAMRPLLEGYDAID